MVFRTFGTVQTPHRRELKALTGEGLSSKKGIKMASDKSESKTDKQLSERGKALDTALAQIERQFCLLYTSDAADE